jgi:3-oxoadipate enol-lactonase
VLRRWFTPRFENVGEYREMLVGFDPETYAVHCEALSDWNFWDRLEDIEAPTLVLAGAEDLPLAVEHAKRMADRIPRARLLVLGAAAHLASVERPDGFNRALLEHLDQAVLDRV